MEKYRSLKYPPVVFWEVTDQCNHNCIHCFNYWRTDKQALANSCLKTEEEYLTIAKRILDQKPVRVIFTGGEPLIAFQRLKPALKLLHENRVNLSFNTNAALLTEEIASFFAEHRIGMFISFPSCKQAEFDRIVDCPGAFDRVGKALELARQHMLFFSFNMVVSRINLGSVYETAQYLKNKFHINRLSVTRVSTPINAIDRFGEYILSPADLADYMHQCVQARRELNVEITAASPITPCSITTQDAFDLFAFAGGCEAGKTSYVISAAGKVRACARDFEEYGDFMEEPFNEIWARMASWRDESFIPAECADCAHKSRCRGGCRVDGIVKTGARSCLDNYSDPKCLPIPFTKQPGYLPTWDYATKFTVPASVQKVKEAAAVRLSYRSGYVYCTESFSTYLQPEKSFTLDDFCRQFNQSLDDSRAVLKHLFDNGIIYITQ